MSSSSFTFLRAWTTFVLPEQFLHSYLKEDSGAWACLPDGGQLWTYPNRMHLCALQGPAYGRDPVNIS